MKPNNVFPMSDIVISSQAGMDVYPQSVSLAPITTMDNMTFDPIMAK